MKPFILLTFFSRPRQAYSSTPKRYGLGFMGLSADAFFADTVLHEINVVINSGDWQALKDNYLLDTVLSGRLPLARPDRSERRYSVAR